MRTQKTKQKKSIPNVKNTKNIVPLREIERKSFHVIFGVAILAMIYLAGTKTSLSVLFTLLVVGVIISWMIKKGINLGFLKKIVEKVERDNEKNFPGKAAVYFFASAIILLGVFPTNPMLILAVLSVQVFADSSAAIIGMKFGKHKLYKKKSWEGSITCFIVASACLAVFYPLPTAVIAGFVATAVEVLPLDDNLFVPLITAAALMALII